MEILFIGLCFVLIGLWGGAWLIEFTVGNYQFASLCISSLIVVFGVILITVGLEVSFRGK